MAPLNRFHILLAHHEHPTWTVPEIARHFGCDDDFVRRNLAREGKVAPRAQRRGKRGPQKNPARSKAAKEQHT